MYDLGYCTVIWYATMQKINVQVQVAIPTLLQRQKTTLLQRWIMTSKKHFQPISNVNCLLGYGCHTDTVLTCMLRSYHCDFSSLYVRHFLKVTHIHKVIHYKGTEQWPAQFATAFDFNQLLCDVILFNLSSEALVVHMCSFFLYFR